MVGPAENPAASQGTVGRLPLLIGFLGGPIVWSIHLLLSEVLISVACSGGPEGFRRALVGGVMVWQAALLLVALLFSLIVVGVDAVAFAAWRKTRAGIAETGERGGAAGRSGWMSLAGILLSTLFLVALLFAGLPLFWLSGCS